MNSNKEQLMSCAMYSKHQYPTRILLTAVLNCARYIAIISSCTAANLECLIDKVKVGDGKDKIFYHDPDSIAAR